MRLTAFRVVVFTFVAALAVFSIVQDRVTAAGARQYVALHTGRDGSTVTIDDVMRPAVRASVRDGLQWSAVVAAVGLGCAVLVARRSRRA